MCLCCARGLPRLRPVGERNLPAAPQSRGNLGALERLGVRENELKKCVHG